MRKDKVYRVAVIGRTGRGNYGHGIDTVWRRIEGVQLVAVADEDPAGLKEAATRLAVSATYADYREMLRKEKPDIVSVAPRWVDAHRDMVLACAEHGASILLEKPMCRTLAEADEMVDACERHHVKLAICHQTRYSPKVKVARDLIASGRIGKVLEVRGRGKEDNRGGGEDLWVLGTHIFDLIRLLVGEPKRCFARVFEGDRPARRSDVKEGNEGIGPLAGDGVEAMFELEGGVCAHFSSHRGAAGNPSRYGMAIHGTGGVLELGTGFLPPMKILEDPSWSPGRTGSRWQDVSSAGVGKPEPLEDLGIDGGNVLLARDLIGAIGDDRQPLGGVYEARAATEMIVAVFASHCLGRAVELPLAGRTNPLLSDF